MFRSDRTDMIKSHEETFNRHSLLFVSFVFLFFQINIIKALASGSVLENNLPIVQQTESKSSISLHKEIPSTKKLPNRSSAEVFSEYQDKIEKLAIRCEELGMTLEAQVTRSYLYKEKPYHFTIPILSFKTNSTQLPSDATKNQQSWFSALQRLQKQYADETYAIAQRYGTKKQGFEVVACILQTLFINPDHEQARRFLGYIKYNGEWRSQWEIRKLEKGYVDDPTFGWILQDHIDKYYNGKRFYKNQWISKEEEEKKILGNADGWRIDTEHFSILSRISLERGVEVGRFLEAYYQTWSRLFYPFIGTEKQWAARLYASDAIVSRKHQVILYRNRAEYIRELRKHDKNALQSVGGYFPNLRCIFVYEPESDNEADCFDLFPMLAHEATHQLFNEYNIPNSNKVVRTNSLGKNGNFWVAEGVAITAESFTIDSRKTKAEIGGYKNVFRIQDALDSLFIDKTYIPLRKYTSMTRQSFQEHLDLNLLYSQAAGLSLFLLFYRNGEYCNAYIRYLYLLYQGNDAPDSLERLTGKSFEELDKEYQMFMREIRNAIKEKTP